METEFSPSTRTLHVNFGSRLLNCQLPDDVMMSCYTFKLQLFGIEGGPLNEVAATTLNQLSITVEVLL